MSAKIENIVLNTGSIEGQIANRIFTRFHETTGNIIIAVGGPGGTGKSTFCKLLQKELPDSSILNLDDYKIPRRERQQKGLFGAHPDANRIDLIQEHLDLVIKGEAFQKPVYKIEIGEASEKEEFKSARFVILDGEISTYKHFRDWVDFLIFIDSDWRTQLQTRITRDIDERGYTPEKAIATFLQSNLREFPKYGADSKFRADINLFCHSDYTLEIRTTLTDD